MSDLVDFLLARIAEDEQRAQAAADVDGSDQMLAVLPDALFEGLRVAFPVRVLAEAEAKRRIIDLHGGWYDDGQTMAHECPEPGGTYQGVPIGFERECATLKTLALPYADHPDYRDEWRP